MLFGVNPVWPVGKKEEKREKPFTGRKSARLTKGDIGFSYSASNASILLLMM